MNLSVRNHGSRGYRLEALESRLLLSADGLDFRPIGQEDLFPIKIEPAEIVEVADSLIVTSGTAVQAASGDSLDMFGFAATADTVPLEIPSAAAVAQEQPAPVVRAEQQLEAAQPAAERSGLQSLVTGIEPTGAAGSAGADEFGQTLAAQLTVSLTVGNAPPADVVPQPTLAAQSFTSTRAETRSALLGSALAELHAFITGKLSEYVTGVLAGTRTFSPGTQSLGSFLTLLTPSLTFRNVVVSAGAVTAGTVTIEAFGATLFDGQPFSAAIADGSDEDAFALSGTYDAAAKTYAVTLDEFQLTVGEAVRVSASSVTVTYDPASTAANQTLATVGSGSFTSPLFSGLGTATLSNFTLRKDGSTSG